MGACIYDIFKMSQFAVCIIICLFAFTTVGGQYYIDRGRKKTEIEEAQLFKNNQEERFQLIISCIKENNSTLCKKIDDNQNQTKGIMECVSNGISELIEEVKENRKVYECYEKIFDNIIDLLNQYGDKGNQIAEQLSESIVSELTKCNRQQIEKLQFIQTNTENTNFSIIENSGQLLNKINVLSGSVQSIIKNFDNNTDKIVSNLDNQFMQYIGKISEYAETASELENKIIKQLEELYEDNKEIHSEMASSIKTNLDILNSALNDLMKNQHTDNQILLEEMKDDYGNMVSVLEDNQRNIISVLTDNKNEICGLIERYEGIVNTISDIKESCSEINTSDSEILDECNKFQDIIEEALTPIKEEILKGIEGNDEKQDDIIKKYNELLGKVNDLIINLSKESNNTIQALKDFYRTLDVKKRIR